MFKATDVFRQETRVSDTDSFIEEVSEEFGGIVYLRCFANMQIAVLAVPVGRWHGAREFSISP